MGFYNVERAWPIDTGWPIRPDSLYGVSKAFGEALARYYSDAFDMSMICLRIGWFTSARPDRRQLAPLWISARDLAQIVQLSLDTPRRFGIYNATSNNAERQWDLRTARDAFSSPPDARQTLRVTPPPARWGHPDRQRRSPWSSHSPSYSRRRARQSCGTSCVCDARGSRA